MEESRLKTLMRNNGRAAQRLGIRFLASVVASPTVFSPKKSKNGGSGSEYDPEGEEDLNQDNGLQVVTFPASLTSSREISTMKVLPTQPVWNCLLSVFAIYFLLHYYPKLTATCEFVA